jgi:glycosyltransferase involved in cell wall biosynthesis
MKVYVFSIVWNEEYMLPYFLRHYGTFADKIFIIDDHSTDKTAKIARAHPKVQWLKFPYDRMQDDADRSQCFADFAMHYGHGEADYVMCVDADEFLYHKDMLGELKKHKARGDKALKTIGYQMMSQAEPRLHGQIYDECQTGDRSKGYDKPVIFEPALAVKFSHGQHDIQIARGLRPIQSDIKLLHFRYLSRESYVARCRLTYPRNPAITPKIADYRINRALKRYDYLMEHPEDLDHIVL